MKVSDFANLTHYCKTYLILKTAGRSKEDSIGGFESLFVAQKRGFDRESRISLHHAIQALNIFQRVVK